MASLDYCTLGSAKLDATTKLPTLQAVVPLTGDDDVEHFGDVDTVCALGVTALPWPADATGHAEGVIARDVGNADGVVVGARDERCAHVYGNLEPGDTALHSTDPDASAQLICKGKKRQVTLAVEDSKGKDMVVSLDGKADKITISGFKCVIEMSRENGIVLGVDGGSKNAAIWIKPSGEIFLKGGAVYIGETPTVQAMHTAPGTLSTSVLISP